VKQNNKCDDHAKLRKGHSNLPVQGHGGQALFNCYSEPWCIPALQELQQNVTGWENPH
jgi:hypothetical protein